MRFVSWLLTLAVVTVALCFALNNRQGVTVSLWPFGVEVVAPLYLFTLGTLLLGLLLGGMVGWVNHMPHRREARRLRRANNGLEEKIATMKAKLPSEEAKTSAYLPWMTAKTRFWRKP